ncbi:ribonuclease H-like domain-containing protein [Tanacetum coccineum]
MSLHGYSDGEYEHDDENDVTLISKLDLSHPLHLHPNDYSTLTIVSIKLKGTENYNVWSCAMLLALERRNRTGFIDKTYRRSNIDERAFEVWDELKETFDRVDGYVTFNLHHKINSLTQNGSPVAEYFNKLSTLWKQFDALVQLSRCTCHAADDFKKHNQLMKLMQFLMGLDDTYMQLISNILSRDPLPDAKGAYVLISSEESHISVVTGSGAEPSQRAQCLTLVSTFSDEQISKLLSLIKENSLNDKGKGIQANMTRANQHLTYTDKDLVNVIDISYLRIKVSHPNGTEALITKVARDSKFIVGFDESKCFLMSQNLMDL